jgi:hypothetical protein
VPRFQGFAVNSKARQAQAQYTYLLKTIQLKLTSGRLSKDDLNTLNSHLGEQQQN